MAKLSFSVDQKFLENGAEYRLHRFTPDAVWQVENVLTGEFTQRALDELHEQYRTMKLTLIVDSVKQTPLSERIGRVILPERSLYSENQLSRAKRYEIYQERLDKICPFPTRRRDLQKEIDSIARDLGEVAPSAKTILRRRQEWLNCESDFRSQILRFDAQGRRNRLSPAIEWLIDKTLGCTYLTALKMKVSDAWKVLDQKVEAINSGDVARIEKMFPKKEREEDEFEQLRSQVPITAPSVFSLYRRVHQMSYYEYPSDQPHLLSVSRL